MNWRKITDGFFCIIADGFGFRFFAHLGIFSNQQIGLVGHFASIHSIQIGVKPGVFKFLIQFDAFGFGGGFFFFVQVAFLDFGLGEEVVRFGVNASQPDLVVAVDSEQFAVFEVFVCLFGDWLECFEIDSHAFNVAGAFLVTKRNNQADGKYKHHHEPHESFAERAT